MQSVLHLVGFSDLKLMKSFVSSELTWLFRNQFAEIFLSLVIMLIKCGFLLSIRIYRCFILDVEE
ncbi:hypothetical protein Golob_024311 [Gossypium lobatum]|uniref:Uncharacterized protein n=1 Tax=Gossypium lobatum TaxID=34289 RepID=A0A7J8NK30_9ROSI|nr:hypothetical protein [Gossypium lobatum]